MPTAAAANMHACFLTGWSGKLVCDDFSGYKALFDHGVVAILERPWRGNGDRITALKRAEGPVLKRSGLCVRGSASRQFLHDNGAHIRHRSIPLQKFRNVSSSCSS